MYGAVIPSGEIHLDKFENIVTSDTYIAVVHKFIHERNNLCDFYMFKIILDPIHLKKQLITSMKKGSI